MARPPLVPFLLLALALPGVEAQEVDRRQLDEHAARDRAYVERLRREAAGAAAPTDGHGPAALLDALDRRRIRRARLEGLELVTDDARIDLDAIAALAQGLRAAAAELPLPGATADATAGEATLVLAWSSYTVRRVDDAGGLRHAGLRPRRFWHPASDTLAIHTDDGGAELLLAALRDLLAHRLVDRRAEAGDGALPRWLLDGLAHELALTFRDRDGRRHVGAIGGSSLAPFHGEPADRGALAAAQLRRAKRTWRRAGRGDGVLVEALLADGARSGGDGDAFGLGWGLVHYLRHADDGRHTAAFEAWARRGAPGGADGLLTELEERAAALERAAAAHVAARHARPRIRWSAGTRTRLAPLDCGATRRP